MVDIYRVLAQLDIPFQKIDHPPVATVEEAGPYRRVLPGCWTKNLFLRNKTGHRHYLVITEADKTVDLRRLRQQLGESALSFASPRRLRKYLGLAPGCVSPFGLVHEEAKNVVVIVDRDLLRHVALGFHPNVNTATLVVQTKDFQRFIEHWGNPVHVTRLD